MRAFGYQFGVRWGRVKRAIQVLVILAGGLTVLYLIGRIADYLIQADLTTQELPYAIDMIALGSWVFIVLIGAGFFVFMVLIGAGFFAAAFADVFLYLEEVEQ